MRCRTVVTRSRQMDVDLLCGIEDIGYLLLISSAFIDTWFSASASQWWLVVARLPSKQPLCLQGLSCVQCFDAGLLSVSSLQQAVSEQHQSSVGCLKDDEHCSVLYCLSQQRWNPVTRLSITWPVVQHLLVTCGRLLGNRQLLGCSGYSCDSC